MERIYTVDEIKNIAGEIAKRHGLEWMFLMALTPEGMPIRVAIWIFALSKSASKLV